MSVAAQAISIPVVAVFMAADEASTAPLATGEPRIPLYAYPESAARALGAAVRVHRAGGISQRASIPSSTTSIGRLRSRSSVAPWFASVDDGGWLEPEEIDEILSAYGIRSARMARGSN